MFRIYEFIDPYSGEDVSEFNTFEIAFEYYSSTIKDRPNNPITLVEVLDEHKGKLDSDGNVSS